MKVINVILLSIMLLFIAGCSGSYNFEENQFSDKTEVSGEVETNEKIVSGEANIDKENKEINANIKVEDKNIENVEIGDLEEKDINIEPQTEVSFTIEKLDGNEIYIKSTDVNLINPIYVKISNASIISGLECISEKFPSNPNSITQVKLNNCYLIKDQSYNAVIYTPSGIYLSEVIPNKNSKTNVIYSPSKEVIELYNLNSNSVAIKTGLNINFDSLYIKIPDANLDDLECISDRYTIIPNGVTSIKLTGCDIKKDKMYTMLLVTDLSIYSIFIMGEDITNNVKEEYIHTFSLKSGEFVDDVKINYIKYSFGVNYINLELKGVFLLINGYEFYIKEGESFNYENITIYVEKIEMSEEPIVTLIIKNKI